MGLIHTPYPLQQKPMLGSMVNWGHPLSQGLVGCWLMNEGAGNLVKDIALGNNGTTSGTLWSPSQCGMALNFDGATSYENITLRRTFIQSNFSLCFLFKIDTIDKTTRYIFDSGYTSPYDPNGLNITFINDDYNDNRLTVRIYDSDGYSISINPANVISTSVLYWLVVTYNNLTKVGNLYLNKDFGTKTAPTARNGQATPNTLGSYTNNLFGFFDGSIVYFYAYNRVLSPQEIQSLYVAPYQFIQRPRIYTAEAGTTTTTTTTTSTTTTTTSTTTTTTTTYTTLTTTSTTTTTTSTTTTTTTTSTTTTTTTTSTTTTTTTTSTTTTTTSTTTTTTTTSTTTTTTSTTTTTTTTSTTTTTTTTSTTTTTTSTTTTTTTTSTTTTTTTVATRTYFVFENDVIKVVVKGTVVAKFKENGDIDVNAAVNENAF
jgi:hypothetical protein